MSEEFKEELVNAVKAATEVLNDEEALAIVKICKIATDREIASVTEEYLAEQINSEGDAE